MRGELMVASSSSSLFGFLIVNTVLALLVVPPELHAQEKSVWERRTRENTVADQEDWSLTQREVWEREKMYWRLRKAHDLDGFMKLWAEEFVGWSGPGIIERDDVRRLVTKEFENRSQGELRYKLIPRAVRAHGDVVATFYTALFTHSSAADTARVRFHHAWRQSDGRWKIIEGLSAAPLNSRR